MGPLLVNSGMSRQQAVEVRARCRFNGAAAREQRNEVLPFVWIIGALARRLRLGPSEIVGVNTVRALKAMGSWICLRDFKELRRVRATPGLRVAPNRSRRQRHKKVSQLRPALSNAKGYATIAIRSGSM